MRLASYNLENLFARAKALNTETWDEGRAALDAFSRLNTLFRRPNYSARDKTQILKHLETLDLLRSDEGPLALLRRNRGQLIRRPRNGDPEITADGRTDWIGWIELKKEPVTETATLNTARIIGLVQADILAVVEAEDRVSLSHFNAQVLPQVQATPYRHVMLIDGNDDRGIDVGLLTTRPHPIASITSHIDDRNKDGTRIFSRDCPEYAVTLPSGRTLWVLVNHFKSKGHGSPAENDAKRTAQAARARALGDALLDRNEPLVAIVGDLNDTPDRPPLQPLLGDASRFRDSFAHPSFEPDGRPGTFGNATKSQRLDYILLSPELWDRTTRAGIERRGVWGGKNGTLWPVLDTMTKAVDAASDHAALWVDLDL